MSDVSIVTRTAEQSAGVRLCYDHEGRLASQAPAARAVGTTVAVRDIFKTLPVRWGVERRPGQGEAQLGGVGRGGRGRVAPAGTGACTAFC